MSALRRNAPRHERAATAEIVEQKSKSTITPSKKTASMALSDITAVALNLDNVVSSSVVKTPRSAKQSEKAVKLSVTKSTPVNVVSTSASKKSAAKHKKAELNEKMPETVMEEPEKENVETQADASNGAAGRKKRKRNAHAYKKRESTKAEDDGESEQKDEQDEEGSETATESLTETVSTMDSESTVSTVVAVTSVVVEDSSAAVPVSIATPSASARKKRAADSSLTQSAARLRKTPKTPSSSDVSASQPASVTESDVAAVVATPLKTASVLKASAVKASVRKSAKKTLETVEDVAMTEQLAVVEVAAVEQSVVVVPVTPLKPTEQNLTLSPAAPDVSSAVVAEAPASSMVMQSEVSQAAVPTVEEFTSLLANHEHAYSVLRAKYEALKTRKSSALLADSTAQIAQWQKLQAAADQRNTHVHVRVSELEVECAKLKEQLESSRADVSALQTSQAAAARSLTEAQAARHAAEKEAQKNAKTAAAEAQRLERAATKDEQWKAVHAASKQKLADAEQQLEEQERIIQAFQLMTATRFQVADNGLMKAKCVNPAEGRVIHFTIDMSGETDIKYAPLRVEGVSSVSAEQLSKEIALDSAKAPRLTRRILDAVYGSNSQ